MSIVRAQTKTVGLGGKRHREEKDAPSTNHMASEKALPKQVKAKIASMGLTRVAGNVFEQPSTRDFWKVEGSDIKRLTKGSVVNNGERIVAAPVDNPRSFLDDILSDLQF